MHQPRRFRTLISVVAVIIILDQLTKAAARQLAENITIIPQFFSIINIRNTGASFGLFQNNNTVLLVVGIIIVIGLIYYILTDKDLDKKSIILLSFITAGAVSNLIDRVALGAVTDFIHFSFWPTFNIADSAITVGVMTLIILQLKNKNNSE